MNRHRRLLPLNDFYCHPMKVLFLDYFLAPRFLFLALSFVGSGFNRTNENLN